MKRFYNASAKAPESAFPPALFVDPGEQAAGRPTTLMLDAKNWQDPTQSYLVQQGPRPFCSTYERLAGGTSHSLAPSPTLPPTDFPMEAKLAKDPPHLPVPHWP